MRTSVVVLSVIFLTSCGLFKKKVKDDEVVAETEMSKDPDAEIKPRSTPVPIETVQPAQDDLIMAYGEVCEAFLAALKSGSTAPMEPFFPDVRMAKSIAPNEVANKTDEQIENEILKGMRDRFTNNLTRLRAHAAENNVDLNKQSLLNCLYVESKDPDMVPRVLSVEIGSPEKKYPIAITVLKLDSKTYVFEILNTTGIFNK